MASSRSRLLKEYREVVNEGTRARSQHDHDQIVIFPKDASNLMQWMAYIRGPDATPYQDRFFQLAIDISTSYPLEAPFEQFVTPIFHPNIHFKVSELETRARALNRAVIKRACLQTGEICLDILKHEWSPAWTLTAACRAVVAMLAHPEPDSPLNCNAGNLLRDGDRLGFESLARMYAIDLGLVALPDSIPYYGQQ